MGSILNKKFLITAAHCFCGANGKVNNSAAAQCFRGANDMVKLSRRSLLLWC
jgi:hypothetical protein